MTTNPTYVIIAPSRIRPNSEYHVSLDLANTTIPIDVEVQISGQTTSGQVENHVSNTICIQPSDTSSLLNLSIGDWQDGNYKLIVKGKSEELQFSKEIKLEFVRKICSIFVQTDQTIYQPGQLVKFRAIVVDSSLVPNVTSALDVFVKDPKRTVIKQWKRIFPQKGIFSEEIQLSDQPPLGDWSITVQTRGQQYSKDFTVAEFVLPTFSVDIAIPPYVTYAQSEAIATVKANYVHGKPVKGECILTVQIPDSRFGLIKFQTKAKINGEITVPINLTKDLNLTHTYNVEQKIEFHATVTEDLTGKRNDSSSVLTIYTQETKVELVKAAKAFKPGLKYTAFLKVAYQDDKPVEDNGPPVVLKYNFSYSGPDCTEMTQSVVPEKGLVRMELNPPRCDQISDFTIIQWRAEYRGTTSHFKSIKCAKSPSNLFIQVVQAKNDHQSTLENLFDTKSVGEQVTFQMNAVEPLTEVVYKIMSKGDIVLAGTIKANQTKSIDITIPITKQMAPTARLLVYYVRPENQEIVADVLNFKVNGLFSSTPVKLSSNVSEIDGQVDITVQTQPSAYVALLGMDQSILQLKKGNDLCQDVHQDLELHDGGKRGTEESSTAGDVFNQAGLVILTNQLLNKIERPQIATISSSSSSKDCECFNVLYCWCHELKGPKPIKLHQKFPETWIWKNVCAGVDGFAKFSDKIPKTVTSWIVSAFAMDPTTGLGVAEKNLELHQVFRPFFAQLSMPNSIIRGESVEIQIRVFNYQKEPVQAEVVLVKDKYEFEFVYENEIQQQIDPSNKRRVLIGPFDSSLVCFTIYPIKIGYTDIRVNATCHKAGDSLVKKLLVRPEGQTQYFNKATLFVKLDKKSSNKKVKQKFTIEIPPNAVPGSAKVKVSGTADILGSTLHHVDDLLRLPLGCGEQNMINFVPNIVILKYLSQTNRLTDSIKTKALASLFTAYQRELTYKHGCDGSFSAFGNSDLAGSTWLTAYVVKWFIQASPYLDIDQSVINRAIKWLFRQQIENGNFREYGVQRQQLQGGTEVSSYRKRNASVEQVETFEDSAALAAFVLIAILHQDKSKRRSYEEKIKKSENYIYRRILISYNVYEVSLCAHALHLADSEHKDVAYEKLIVLAECTKDGLLYWTNNVKSTKPTEKRESTLKRPRIEITFDESIPNFIEIESTAYALLTLVARSDTDNAIQAARWLISKQNSNGGFASTQDTVIGLEALGAAAEKIFTQEPKQTSVSVKYGKQNGKMKQEQKQVLNFDADNSQALQQFELEPDSQWVEFEATEYGTALVQVSYQYNITSNQRNKTEIFTNMTVLEVELPSGYAADLEAFKTENKGGINRVELGNNERTLFVYFSHFSHKENYLKVTAHRRYRVENIKPVPVTIYDYYHRNKISRVFYKFRPYNCFELKSQRYFQEYLKFEEF